MPEFNKKHLFKSDDEKRYSVAAGYTLVVLWVLFTFILISWVVLASFSTSQEIFSDHMFKFVSGFHFDNYVKAWSTQRVSVFFYELAFVHARILHGDRRDFRTRSLCAFPF